MGFAMRHHGESRTETGNGSALSSITETDMDPKKTTLAELIDAFVAADRPAPAGRLGAFAPGLLARRPGRRTRGRHYPDDVDAALAQLIARGRLRPLRGKDTGRTGAPLKGPRSTATSTISAGSTGSHGVCASFRARTSHRSPGLERAPQPVDPERYLRPEEVERLVVMARVVDRRWRDRLAVLHSGSAYVTGLRRGNSDGAALARLSTWTPAPSASTARKTAAR